MKFCKDCKWKGSHTETCHAPQNMVTGTQSARYTFCKTHREGLCVTAYIDNSCGPQARWFEPTQENVEAK